MPTYTIKIHSRYKDMDAFVRSLPQTFDSEGTLLFKKRNTVKAFTVNGTPLVVKRFACPNALQRVAYTLFKPTKAIRAYMHADLFTARGISTPAAVAYVQAKRGCLASEGFFVSLRGEGSTVRERLLPGGPSHEFDEHKYGDDDLQLIDSMAAFIANMHVKGVIHGDLNISNMLCQATTDGATRLTIVDTDRARLCNPTKDECLSDIMRTTHNRQLLSYITSMYARKRGWDASECTSAVMNMLDSFEKRKLLKRKLKGWTRGKTHLNS